MFCVIQEIQRKKPDRYGAYRVLEAYSPYEINGRPKWGYRYTGDRFDRPIMTAYKVSIHESKRVNGVVTKQQLVVTTVSYYDLTEYWIGDCMRGGKLESIAASLNVTVENLWELINAKVDPLQERITSEFKKTEEYKTHAKHATILTKYSSKKAAFAKAYGVDPDTYDYCYNIYGEVMNQAYLDEIMEADRVRRETSRSYRAKPSGNYDYSKLFSASSGAYSAEDKAILKKFYKSLSKLYHPDMNRDIDTHAEMVLLNRLKEEWGV